jgi:hypothetical protein
LYATEVDTVSAPPLTNESPAPISTPNVVPVTVMSEAELKLNASATVAEVAAATESVEAEVTPLPIAIEAAELVNDTEPEPTVLINVADDATVTTPAVIAVIEPPFAVTELSMSIVVVAVNVTPPDVEVDIADDDSIFSEVPAVAEIAPVAVLTAEPMSIVDPLPKLIAPIVEVDIGDDDSIFNEVPAVAEIAPLAVLTAEPMSTEPVVQVMVTAPLVVVDIEDDDEVLNGPAVIAVTITLPASFVTAEANDSAPVNALIVITPATLLAIGDDANKLKSEPAVKVIEPVAVLTPLPIDIVVPEVNARSPVGLLPTAELALIVKVPLVAFAVNGALSNVNGAPMEMSFEAVAVVAICEEDGERAPPITSITAPNKVSVGAT